MKTKIKNYFFSQYLRWIESETVSVNHKLIQNRQKSIIVSSFYVLEYIRFTQVLPIRNIFAKIEIKSNQVHFQVSVFPTNYLKLYQKLKKRNSKLYLSFLELSLVLNVTTHESFLKFLYNVLSFYFYAFYCKASCIEQQDSCLTQKLVLE